MKRQVDTKFFMFNQNNSGGSFDVDENVCHRVVIEAIDGAHARSIFEPMIECQSGSCPCCGDRWYPEHTDEINLSEWKEKGYPVTVYGDGISHAESLWMAKYGSFTRAHELSFSPTSLGGMKCSGYILIDTLEQYLQMLANGYGETSPDARVHYLDGTKLEVFKV